MLKPHRDAQPAEHMLPSHFVEHPISVLVVGCGGVGTAVAAGLIHLHKSLLAYGHPYGLAVTLADGDVIAPTNVVRQPFSESEIGLNKAEVLVSRYNLFWGVDWRAQPRHLKRGDTISADVVIGCVDSRRARRLIQQATAKRSKTSYWLDIGNNADSGQFVLGQPVNDRTAAYEHRLPTIAELYPEAVDPKRDRHDDLPSCSALEALERQEPFVNQTLAYSALALLARLFRYGRIAYHVALIDIANGVSAYEYVARPRIAVQSGEPTRAGL